MAWLFLGLGILGLGCIYSFLCKPCLRATTLDISDRRPDECMPSLRVSPDLVSASLIILGCICCLVAVVMVLADARTLAISIPWQIPYGSFSLALDNLSVIFLLPILILSSSAALYAVGYLKGHGSQTCSRQMWFLYSILVASMILVVLARNGILFLLAWEVMTVSSYFLVVHEDRDAGVRTAGWTYLVASQIGTLFLLALFALLASKTGSLDFEGFRTFGESWPALTNVAFVLALVGFGVKAGFVPMHVWLPEAHPAAPSHVSALMSGVMIKTGIYGLVRMLTFLGPPPAWWGYTLVAVGVISGVFGVLFALAEHDLKRLLAYHSVENIGIITIGLGLGVLGLSYHLPLLVILGFAGGLLHVLNHAMFKGLLFLSAGVVVQATGTRNIDVLGGLSKHLPWTSFLFLLGSVAICGLPPLNGFVSEFLIYICAYSGLVDAHGLLAVSALVAIAGLALIGGLAAACFSKAFGIIFLGEPRSKISRTIKEIRSEMLLGMVVPALVCVAIGLLGPMAFRFVWPAVLVLGGGSQMGGELLANDLISSILEIMLHITWGALAFALLVALLVMIRALLLRRRVVTKTGTWDCGYAKPMARMQYSASSFAQPLISLFNYFVWSQKEVRAPLGLFPDKAHFHSRPKDTFREGLIVPLFRSVRWGMARLRWLQHGHLHFYILYIALAALILVLVEL